MVFEDGPNITNRKVASLAVRIHVYEGDSNQASALLQSERPGFEPSSVVALRIMVGKASWRLLHQVQGKKIV